MLRENRKENHLFSSCSLAASLHLVQKRMFLSRKSCIKQLLFLESEDIFFLKGEVGLATFLFIRNINFSIPWWKLDENPLLDTHEKNGKAHQQYVTPVIFSPAQGIPALQGSPLEGGNLFEGRKCKCCQMYPNLWWIWLKSQYINSYMPLLLAHALRGCLLPVQITRDQWVIQAT